MNLISRGKCLLTGPVACFSGGGGGERGSPWTSGGEEREGAQSPPQPAGGPHQQWDPVWVSPAGGGHRVSVSTLLQKNGVITEGAGPRTGGVVQDGGVAQEGGGRGPENKFRSWILARHLEKRMLVIS